MLRALAQSGFDPEAIARRLRRSVSAVRNKASMHGISLSKTHRRDEEQVRAASS